MSTSTFIESLLPSVHDTLSLREALSKLARNESFYANLLINNYFLSIYYLRM